MEKLQEKITYLLNYTNMHKNNLKQGYLNLEMKFNVSGTTPAERNRAIVLPIYKKEGRKDPDNYTSKTN
jgi:hypothetical protein